MYNIIEPLDLSDLHTIPFMRSASNIMQWWQQRKKWELDSGSRLQLHRGFIQSWKLWLNLCSLR